jgi:hypothetical protein
MHQKLQTDSCAIVPVNSHVSSYSPTDTTVVLLYSCTAGITKIQIQQAYFEYVVHILHIPQHRPIVNGSSCSNPEHVDYKI